MAHPDGGKVRCPCLTRRLLCFGPTHRLQELLEALSGPGQLQPCYILFASVRLSPAARERVRGHASASKQGRHAALERSVDVVLPE